MSQYTQDKAKPRDSNQTDTTDFERNTTKESGQERFQGTGVRTITPNPGPNLNVGNQVRLGPNTENTSQVKNPLQSYQRRVMSSDSNPDRGNDRSGRTVAPGKTSREDI